MGIQKELEGNKFSWSLKYRPKTIDDIALPKRIKERTKSFVKNNNLPNLLFSGRAGIGKSTLAYVLAYEFDAETLYINCSKETSIDVVRNNITKFATSVSFDNKQKIIIGDEVDGLSPQAMNSLKAGVEQLSKGCSFIFITNHKDKIIDPLKSRLETIDFNFNKAEVTEVKKQFYKATGKILVDNEVKFDKKALQYIINLYFPDMRKILIELHKYSDMELLNDVENIKSQLDSNIEEFVESIKEKNFNKINEYCNNISLDVQSWYIWLEKNLKLMISEYGMKKEYIGWFIVTLHKYMYQSSFVADGTINMKAFMFELLMVEGGLFE